MPQVNNQPGTQVSFFDTNAAALANVAGTNITSVTINGNLTVHARVSYQSCVLIFPVVFNLVNTPKIAPEVNATIKNICDNNADGKENLDIRVYESQININNENLVFTYYQNYNSANNSFSNQYPDPANISVGNGSVVYVMAKFRNSSCFSVSKLILILHFIRLFISIKMRCLKFVIKILISESLLICLKLLLRFLTKIIIKFSFQIW
jgi:hypothetical protein